MDIKERIAGLERLLARLWSERRAGDRVDRMFRETPLAQAFESVESSLTEEWKKSPDTDSDGRERIYREIHALNLVRAHLSLAVRKARAAEAEIPEVEDQLKRMKK